MPHPSWLALMATLAALAGAQTPRFQVLNEQIPRSASAIHGFVDFDLDYDLDLLAVGPIAVNDGNARFSAGPSCTPNCVGYNSAVAIGDLNGDAFPDVLVGSSVRLNTGALSFTPGPPAPSTALALVMGGNALGDVDGDGDLDACLAGIAYSGTAVQPRLWLNDGSGSFADAPAASMPAIVPLVDHVAMLDFDGDGDVDILLWRESNYGPGPNSATNFHPHLFYRNDGTGSFTQVVNVPGPGVPSVLAIGDFNGDALPDLAFATTPYAGPADGITLNGGNGSFAPFVPTLQSAPALYMVAADLDGDGKAELVRSSGSTSVHPVSAMGVIGPASQVFTNEVVVPRCFAADLDGDGDRDVISGLFVLLNDGAGTLTPLFGDAAPSLFEYGWSVSGDVDGDGDVDRVGCGVAFPTGSSPSFLVSLNDGFGNFAPDPGLINTSGCPTCPVGVSALELDGDGDLDLFAWHPANTVYRNVGGAWLAAAVIPQPNLTMCVAQGDLDGDGDGDLVVGGISSNLFLGLCPGLVVFNLGGGSFSVPVPLPPHATRGIALLDADGDGDLDIAEANWSQLGLYTDSAALLLNDGAGGFVQAPATAFASPFSLQYAYTVVAGDLDGDGDQDLVFDGRVQLNSGTGTFAPGVLLPLSQVTDVFDADGDGDLDVLGVHNSGGSAIFFNSGLATFPASEIMPGLAGSRADFDLDGDPDLLGGGRVLSNTTRQIARGGIARPGRTASIELYGPPGAPFDLYASAGSTHLPVPPYGTVLIDPATAFPAMSGVFSAAGTATLLGLVPNDPALIGLTVYWQAGLPVQQRLTNLEVMTVLGL